MKFFKYFPKTVDSSSRIIANLSKKVVLSTGLRNEATLYYTHRLDDGERLDTLSKRAYDDDQYHWVIAMINNMMDPRFDVPLTYTELQNLIVEKYGSLEVAMTTVHHYVDSLGNIVDEYTSPKIPVYCDEYEENVNEAKRTIKLVRKEYISQFTEQLKKVLGYE